MQDVTTNTGAGLPPAPVSFSAKTVARIGGLAPKPVLGKRRKSERKTYVIKAIHPSSPSTKREPDL